MSDDALVALLKQTVFFRPLRDGTASPTQEKIDDFENRARARGARSLAAWLAARGVVVLPADHPLRTGEQNEQLTQAAYQAFLDSLGEESLWLRIETSVRAALAVLRESLDK